MGIFKRSIVSITQRLWKSLILLLVVFSLGNVIAAAVTVRDATANVEKSMKERLGSYVTVDMNEEYLQNPNPDISEYRLSKTVADKIGESSRVREFTYSMMGSVGGDGLKKYESSNVNFQFGAFGGDDVDTLFDFSLVGDKNGTPNDVANGKIELKEGRFPSTDDKDKNPYVLTISDTVAQLNDLKVGDKINLTSGVIDYGTGQIMSNDLNVLDKIEQEFEIVGIFKNTDKKPESQMEEMMAEFSQNNMYTTIEASAEIDSKSANIQAKHHDRPVEEFIGNVSPTYILNSVDDLEAFVEEYEAMLPKAYLFNTSKDSFDSIASSITNMNNLSNNVYYFGVAIAVVILSLIIILFLRERKTEFGIYQALGETRLKTMMQIGLEVIIITVIGVSLALFSGNILAKTVSTQMIETQLLADEQKESNGMGMAISMSGNEVNVPEISKEEVIESYAVEMTQEYVISFYTVMITAATTATLISMVYILRLKPREILL